MKKKFMLVMLVAGGLCCTACQETVEEFEEKGGCIIQSLTGPATAYMGDSIQFEFQVKGEEIPLNQAKLQLFFGDELVSTNMVSERMMTLKGDGTYQGKLMVPFRKDVQDGVIHAKLRVQNERFAQDEQTLDIAISRPVYDKLVLQSQDGQTYDMLPTGTPFEYAVTGNFPSELYANISAKGYGANGNDIVWGSTDGQISNEATGLINFSADTDGTYQVTFNTLTFEGSPFIKFALNGDEFVKIDDLNFKVERQFTQGEIIEITGLKDDYPNYWINPGFFTKVSGTNGKKLQFLGRDGLYRLTVCKANNKKQFKVDVLNLEGTGLGNLQNGDDALWCVGDANIGFPSYSSNGCNWNTARAICLTPLGNGIHQLVLQKGVTINSCNFKFYSGSNWEGEFKKNAYQTINLNPFFSIPADDGNIREGSQSLEDGKYYIITVDVSETANNTKAVVSVEAKDEMPEVTISDVEP